MRLLHHAILASALASIACGSGDTVTPCPEIPPNGCPIGRGGTCDDPTCSGVYDCEGGNWTLVEACDHASGGGGTGGSGGAGGGAGTGGAGGCAPPSIDLSGQTTGCAPDLENPDCPVEAAEQCAASACLTGCIDFYLCTAMGWTAVAYCDMQGVLHVTQ